MKNVLARLFGKRRIVSRRCLENGSAAHDHGPSPSYRPAPFPHQTKKAAESLRALSRRNSMRTKRNGRGEWIRTTDLLVPNQDISTTYKHRRMKQKDLHVFDLDPAWTLNGGFLAVGPWLDPPFHALVIHVFLRARTRFARTFENPTKICCSDRF
jgi:hypothetical protein